MTVAKFKNHNQSLNECCKSLGIRFYFLKNSSHEHLLKLSKMAKDTIKNDDSDVIHDKIPIFENMVIEGTSTLPKRSDVLKFLNYLNNHKKIPPVFLCELMRELSVVIDDEFERDFILVHNT